MMQISKCVALAFGILTSATALAAESGASEVTAGDAGLMLLMGVGLAARQLRRQHMQMRTPRLAGGFTDPGR